jgi:hypothetical protein
MGGRGLRKIAAKESVCCTMGGGMTICLFRCWSMSESKAEGKGFGSSWP